MRAILVLLGLVLLVAVVAISLGWWRPAFVAGSLPRVAVQGGSAPKFEPNLPSVDLTTVNKTVSVPAIEVRQPANTQAPAQ